MCNQNQNNEKIIEVIRIWLFCDYKNIWLHLSTPESSSSASPAASRTRWPPSTSRRLLVRATKGLSPPCLTARLTLNIEGNVTFYHFVHFVVFQATFGIMATNVLGVLLGWHYNSLALGVIHCGFSLSAFIFLPASPYELVRRGQSANLEPLLTQLRGGQGTSIEQEASMIVRLVWNCY